MLTRLRQSISAKALYPIVCLLIACLLPLSFNGCASKMVATQGAPEPEVAYMVAPRAAPPDFNTESYDRIEENVFQDPKREPLSTFSVDVDTASYSNVRRFLKDGEMPPPDAVRIEEMINYFEYNYPAPTGGRPFSVTATVGECPWQPEYRLLRIALRGRHVPEKQRPPSNLVFLLDVSGSMDMGNKLPLLKKAMKMLVHKLGPQDRVAIVVYAGASGLVLPSTSCGDKNKEKIIDALFNLQAGGSTHGSAGIQLAYEVAKDNFIRGGTNRIILATDGDFNVGVTNQGDLTRLIEEKAKSGIFLTVLGFGMGNLKDSTMEKLADKGNGNYGYIDNITEARKMLVDQMSGTLITIAKDVKIQVEFNPAVVGYYRLVGYENRMLRAEDFKDDTKDAGEIGSDHRVTALYEVIPTGLPAPGPGVDPLKYQKPLEQTAQAASGELATVKLRYKEPDGNKSRQIALVVKDSTAGGDADFQFASAVAAFGMLLRDYPHKGRADYDQVIALAQAGRGSDEFGYRAEFITLVRNARELDQRK